MEESRINEQTAKTEYPGLLLEDRFRIDKLFSLHYFEYMSSFFFPGESHDFWEFICVDKGEVTIGAGEREISLKKGDIAFHCPNEFHWVKANGMVAPNLIVISFSCQNPLMRFFAGKVLHVEETESNLLAKIIAEAGSFLQGRLDDPYQKELLKDPHCDPFSGQLIRLWLEELLIRLYRRSCASSVGSIPDGVPRKSADNTIAQNTDAELFMRIKNYLLRNLSAHVTLSDICRDNLIGRSRLESLFHKKTGRSVIEYLAFLRIDAAKTLIRTEQMNFTQISEALGYSSIHYFSRQFKKIAGLTPSEYASSIRALADRGTEETKRTVAGNNIREM